MKRELTGIYVKEQVNGKWGSWDISDLPWESVEKWLKAKNNIEYIQSCKQLLIESIEKLLNHINQLPTDSSQIEPFLYGDDMEQCHQCLMILNIVASTCYISRCKNEEENE